MKFLKLTFLWAGLLAFSLFTEMKGQTAGKGINNWFSGPSAGVSSSENSKGNAFFGHYAGQVNQNGSSNLFLGYAAGVTNSLGSNNTFIGHQAGAYSQGNNNVLIGYNVGYNANTQKNNENNTLRIGNQGNKTLIIGDFENAKIGIGIHEKHRLNSTLSFGTILMPKKIGLWDNVSDWYGLGIDPLKMRLQVGNTNASFGFFVGDNSEVLTIRGDGRVTIGNPVKIADTSRYLLQVKTGVLSENFGMANVTDWADYVFQEDYKLRTLQEVEDFIKKNKHLPEVPSEATVKAKGYSLHDINTTLLQKIEELTLYTIQQQKQLNIQQKQIETLLKEKTNH